MNLFKVVHLIIGIFKDLIEIRLLASSKNAISIRDCWQRIVFFPHYRKIICHIPKLIFYLFLICFAANNRKLISAISITGIQFVEGFLNNCRY